ncbi:chromosome segregation protein SMC [Staphylococcus lutrae]|uniref:Chromosome partition protein Smc n=1 Tax=Staphylococcus lutrae TaxID=155085 RepID=A0AAC9WJT0_9STAP|nr:chromosome segregation protein SMC [Staphylococcus lutrae]ARJ51675.1 chromosome segregation protein SMC [Staphylococcus lutrae]PNZ39055.1 chromosome segregation protein SMC [Staphylococcus lutrae]
MVYLKSIDAFGFKSFAEATEIRFDQGVTAIVGPNGSGKSNITDAIKWVLGEQSARVLRGSKMEDIIFSGAKHRNAQNLAEVQLKLDNRSGLLNIDAEDVTVTRRLYRNGDSAFYLNNERRRLKDIRDLFLDSGLGKEAFSIISQGRVDEVLNAKPIDRRQIIEESAGVLKYKKRKEASLEKLSQTEDNLTRVEDILYDLEGRVEPLKEEAAIAKEYLQLSEILKDSDIRVTVHDVQSYQSQIAQYDVELNALKGQQADAHQKKSQITHTIQNAKGERFKIDQQLEAVNQQLIEATEQVEKLAGKYQLIEERQKNQSQSNARIEEEQLAIDHQQQLLDKDFSDTEQAICQLKDKRKQLNATIQQLEGQLYQADEDVEADVEQLKDQYYQLITEQADINNDIRFLTRTIEEHKAKQQRIDSRLSEAYAQLKDAQQQKADIEQQQQQQQQQMRQIEDECKQIATALTEAKNVQNQTESQLYQAYRYNDKLKARIETMKMREDDLSNFYQGVKAILKAKDDQLKGIHGAVAQQIDVPSRYTSAIETALGASMQHIIVSDEAAARQAIQFLKTKKMGRVTFLPLSVIQGKSLDARIINTAQQMPGFVTVASDAVQVDSSYRGIINHLLGRTLIVDNLKHANEIARAIQYHTRLVTLEGDVVNPGGSMTGGGTQQRQSLLGQKDEMRQLQAQLEEYVEKTQQLETYCQTKKAEQDQLSEQYVTAQQQYNDCKQALHHLALEHDRYSEVIQRLKHDHEEFEFEKNDGYASAQSEATLQEKQAQQAQMTEQLEKMDQRIKAMTAQRKVTQAQTSQLQQQLHQHQSDLAVVVERMTTQQQQLKRLKHQQGQLDEQQQKLRAQLALINSDEVNDDSTLEAIQTQITQQQTEKDRHIEVQQQLRQQRQEMEDLIESNEQALEHIHQKLLNIENQYQEIKTAQSRLDVLIDQALKHLEETYHITFNYAQQNYPLEAQEIEALRQKVKLTKMSIEELGHVNLNAVEQYEEVSTRYQFLSEQRQDLRDAKMTLEKIIQEMDEEVADRFSQTFHAIQGHFANVFQSLFGGGQAELILTEKDYLTAGVDIKVQPPGKKLQHLSLLSGGERALSAIALLFAILKVRSAPFVILDEVEAALDEANVIRYATYLKTLSKETQFIVITHRKGTMEMCDCLYGVTMQEMGVSRLVSVNLNTIDEVLKEEQT